MYEHLKNADQIEDQAILNYPKMKNKIDYH